MLLSSRGAVVTDLKITEAGTAQFPMVRHAAEVGWTPLTPQETLTRRGGTGGMLFRGELGAALRRFNPWMTDDAIRSTIERLEALPPTIEGNRDVLAWLRGERQVYDDVEQRHRAIRLIDFDAPHNNVLHVTWEWTVKPPARKGSRADVMFVVNGVPVAVVEHKNPTDRDAIKRGIAQLRRYEQETPELVAAAQLFNVTHLLDYWYGVTWNASRRFMARWKERPDDSYRFAVQSFFRAHRFSAHAARLDSLLRRGRRDPQVRATPAPAPRRGAHRGAVLAAGQAARPYLAYPRVRQNLHPAHRRPPDP